MCGERNAENVFWYMPELIADLTNPPVRESKMPSEWDVSFIISLFKNKGEALDWDNYRDLKLTEHELKIVELIIEVSIRGVVNVDDIQFGFMTGRGTTDTIFILRQIQENTSERIVIFILHPLT